MEDFVEEKNETQRDLSLNIYYLEQARNASNCSNSISSGFQQTFQENEGFETKVEIESNQNQINTSSFDNFQGKQESPSNQKIENSVILQQTNTVPKHNPNPQESTSLQPLRTTNPYVSQFTSPNPYLNPNPQEGRRSTREDSEGTHQLQYAPFLINTYQLSPAQLSSNPIEPRNRGLPPYVSATPQMSADLLNYPIDRVIKACGENVPWTDFFFLLIEQGYQGDLEQLISLFSKKAQEVGEELIDAYIDGNFDYLEQFRVDVGGIAGGRKYVKSNILFKFSIDDHKIYKDNRNSMKVAAQELRVINHLVNEKSLNRLFVLPCLTLITKCGLRMYASSLLPLEGKTTLKYGCDDLSQVNRVVRKESETLNNIFHLIGQALNLKFHSIIGDATQKGIICADIEGHVVKDNNYYLVDTTRLFPPEAPSNVFSNEHLFVFLKPELVRSSAVPLNNDCFSVFWNGNENQRKEEEENIRILTESIYSKLIPELSQSIQTETEKIKQCEDVKPIMHKKMLCLRHLPYLIENLLGGHLFTNSFNFLLIEFCARILKWKWYSFRGNEQQKINQTIELKNEYFSQSRPRISNWHKLLTEYFGVKGLRLKSSLHLITQVCQYLPKFEMEILDKILRRFVNLCGIELTEDECKFRVVIKSIEIPKPKSLEDLTQLKNEQEGKFGKDSLILASTLLELARCESNSKRPNYAKILQFYEDSLRIYELHGKENEWQILSVQLEMMYLKSSSTENLQFCLTLKSKMQNLLSNNHPQVVRIDKSIGWMLRAQGRYEEALNVCETALQNYERTIGKANSPYIGMLTDIAWTLNKKGKLNEALKYVETALKTVEQTYGKQSSFYAQTLKHHAILLVNQGKLEEALTEYEECLKIEKRTIGNQHPDYAITLSELGVLCSRKRNFKEGLKYFEKCLKIEEQTIGKQHPTYAITLQNIGTNLSQQGKFEEALKYFEECLNIQEHTTVKHHPAYYETLKRIIMSVKFEYSLKYFEKFVAILELTTGNLPNEDINQVIHYVETVVQEFSTNLCLEPVSFEDFLNSYEKCLQRLRQIIQQQDPSYSRTLYGIGLILQKQGKFEDSLKYFEACLKIQEQTIGKQHPDYAKTYQNIGKNFEEIGDVLKSQGNFKKLLDHFEKWLRIHEQTCGTQNSIFAGILNNIGVVLQNQGKLEESLKYLEECLKIQEQTIGKQHPNYATTLNNIGNNLLQQGEFEESLKYFEECLKIKEQTIGKNQPNYATTLFTIGFMLQKQGKFEASLKYYEECLNIQFQN